jgi:hypothetical protein
MPTRSNRWRARTAALRLMLRPSSSSMPPRIGLPRACHVLLPTVRFMAVRVGSHVRGAIVGVGDALTLLLLLCAVSPPRPARPARTEVPARAQQAAVAFTPGTPVRLCRLQRAAMNGLDGVVQQRSADVADDHVKVQLVDGKVLSIKPANLKRRPKSLVAVNLCDSQESDDGAAAGSRKQRL